MEPMLATCWTSAGAVRPGVTAAESPLPLPDRVAAVSRAGFAGMGIEYADLLAARDTMGLNGLRELLADHDITAVEVEFLDDWFSAGSRRELSDRRRRDLLEFAAELGASHLKVGGGSIDDNADPATMRTEFDRLANEAREHGTRVAIEPGAFSRLRDLDEAIALVRDVANPHGGLLLDVWHLARCGCPYERLPDVVNADQLFAVELDDGSLEHGDDLFADTFDHRLYCGHGEFGVDRFIHAIREVGFQGPWGIEHMSIAHRALPVDTALTQAAAAARELLEKADATR